MSAYDNDPRVQACSDLRWAFNVFEESPERGDPSIGHVSRHPDGSWGARDYRQPPEAATVFPTANEAVRSLIGDPR